jgi:hypothetical protein
MDHSTRNDTIRALAAASAAEIRSRPARALRAHGNPLRAEASGALGFDLETESDGTHMPIPRTTDRELPLERTPNHYTGEHRDEVVR